MTALSRAAPNRLPSLARLLARSAASSAMLLAVAGCSDPVDRPRDTPGDNRIEAAAEAPNTAVQAPPPRTAAPRDGFGGETIGGDGSAITLAPLSPAQIADAKLAGELGCTFAAKGGALLLIAKGNVGSRDPAAGIVNVAGYVEPVFAPGGHDAMARGARFGGQGKTITIAITGPATGGGESPSRPATFTYDRADGAKRVIAGDWTCGP